MRLLLALVVTLAASAQTTAYLRDHGTGSWITGASNTTPIVIETALAHGHSVGQTVGIWSVVFDGGSGCGSGGVLQGRFKVKASVDATHYSITDMDDVDVPAQGTWCDGEYGGNPGGSQWEGATEPYDLVAGIRGWFDGAEGRTTRLISLGAHNGLVSVTISSNVATVVTSFNNYVTTGAKVAVWGITSGSTTALEKGPAGATGEHRGYTVTVDSATQFHFSTSGVTDGPYTGVDETCGPAGDQDCLRISAWAFTGNPWWDGVVRARNNVTLTTSQNGKHVYDGGRFTAGQPGPLFSYAWPSYASSASLAFLVNPKDTTARDYSKYFANHPERSMGVGYAMDETVSQGGYGGNIDFGGHYLLGVALNYAVIRDYLDAGEKATFIGKMFNDVTDAAPCNKVAPYQPGETATFVGTGTNVGTLTGSGTLWLTDPDTTRRLNVGDAVEWAWPQVGSNAREFYVSEVTSDTTATVITRSTAAITTPFTFWIVRGWQTGDCGAMYWYSGWFGGLTHPAVHKPAGGWTSNNPFGPHRPSRNSNNGYTMHAGVMALSLAAADDDERALRRFEKHQSDYFDHYLASSLVYTTGYQRGGAAYSPGRIIAHGQAAATFLQQSVVDFPDLDLGGAWMTSTAQQKVFGLTPDNTRKNSSYNWPIRYGVDDGANQLAIGDFAGHTWAYLSDWSMRHAPTAPASRRLRNWISARGWLTANLIELSSSSLAFLCCGDPAVVNLDHTAQPTQYLFRANSRAACLALALTDCSPDLRGDAVLSRTGWINQNDTLVQFQARAYVDDHDLPMPGSLYVYKRGYLIGDGNAIPGGGTVAATTSAALNNVIEFDGSGNAGFHDGLANGSGIAGPVYVDRWSGADATGDAASRYVYARANVAGAYERTIDRAYVHFAHLKSPAGGEILIRHFDVDISSSPGAIRSRLHYPQNGQSGTLYYDAEGSTSCPGMGGCGSLDSTRWVHTQEDGLAGRENSLTTKFIAPGTATVTWDGSAYPSNTGSDYRVTVCGGAACGDSVDTLEYFEVHRVNTTLSNSTFGVSTLSAGADWTVLQGDDWVYATALGGTTQSHLSFTSTHAGPAPYLLTGLETPYVMVLRNGVPITGSPFAVASDDNTLYFEGAAGTYTIAAGLVMTATPAPVTLSCATGGRNTTSLTMGALGATLDQWSATKTQSWLTLAPTSGVGPGALVATADCTGKAPGTYTDTITLTSTTDDIANTPLEVSVVLTVVPITPAVTFRGVTGVGVSGK